MARVPLPLGFNYYQTDGITFSAQRLINWIPVVAESEALSDRMLMQPLGLKALVDSGLIPNRGSQEMKGIPYFINRDRLVSLSAGNVITDIGHIPGSGRVSLANNGRYLVIVIPGSSAYAFDNETGLLNKITDPDFRIADTVAFKDGFFVFSATAGDVFFSSTLNDPFTFLGLDFGTAEINPDRIVAVHVNHNELFVPGLVTIELFQNVGGSGFPFQRIPGANIQKGLHAKFGIVEFDNTFTFVGGGENEKTAIWKVTGSSSAIKISTNAIDTEIQKYNEEEISNCFAMTYSDRGQFLALFTFESERIPSKTFFYNATASALLGRNIWGEFQTGVNDERFRVNSITKAYGKLLVGDDRSGTIGELDRDTLTYYGEAIYRSSASPPFSQNGTTIYAGSFEATFQAGVGLTNGNDPQARLDFSDDGGHTFSFEFNRSIGKIGKYGQRSVWNRQGSFPVSRTVRLTITDPVRANLIRTSADVQIGV